MIQKKNISSATYSQDMSVASWGGIFSVLKISWILGSYSVQIAAFEIDYVHWKLNGAKHCTVRSIKMHSITTTIDSKGLLVP